MEFLIDIVRNTNFLSKEVKEMIFDMFFECVDLQFLAKPRTMVCLQNTLLVLLLRIERGIS